MRIVAAILVLLALLACDQKAFFDRLVLKEDAEFAKSYLSLFQAHDFAAIEAKIDPALKNDRLREKLEKIAISFPTETPTAVEIIGSHVFTTSNEERVNLLFQYAFPGKWLLTNISLLKKNGNTIVTAVNVEPLKDSLENINRFTFVGKGLKHYIFIALTCTIPLFIVITLFVCMRTPIPRRKWLWVLFVLLGFVQVSLNWTDGSVNFKPFYFQFYDRAVPYFHEAVAIAAKYGLDDKYPASFADAYTDYADALMKTGNTENATAALEKATSRRAKSSEQAPEYTRYPKTCR